MKKGGMKLTLEQLFPLFNNGKNLLSDFITLRKKYTYTYDFEDEEIKVLIDKLTKSLDSFLKYIVLLYQYNNFNKKLDKYVFEMESLKILEENKYITSNVIDEMDKFDERDFTFFFKFFELVLGDEYNTVFRVIENHVMSELSRKKFINEKIPNHLKFFFITNNFSKKRVNELLNEEENKKYLGKLREVKSESNDVFVKINNVVRKFDKLDEEDIDSLYELVIGFYLYCSFVNKNDYKLKIDDDDFCYWYNVKKYSALIKKDLNELNTIKETYTDNMFLPFVLKNYLSVEDLLKYKELDIKKNVLKFFLENDVPYATYQYLADRKFNEISMMNTITLNGSNYENYKVDDKYFSLLPYLNVSSIKKLTPRVLDYLLDVKDHFIKVFNGKYYEMYFEAFIKILKIKDINNYLEIIKRMDFEQVKIFDTINRYLGDKVEVSSDIIATNVMDNINMFIDDEEGVLDKMPIMLSADNNRAILTELLDNGLNIDDIKLLDGTIFCYPAEFVSKVLRIMKGREVDIFMDKKLNPNVIKYITQLIHKQTNYELPPIIIYRPENNK